MKDLHRGWPRGFVQLTRTFWRSTLGAVGLVLCGATILLAAEEGLSEANTQHFAELRRRGLNRLAEAEIEHRLTWPRLTSSEQTALVLELAETLLSHARQLGESQRVSLWERTREVILAQLPNETAPTRRSLLELQLVLVLREEAEACRRVATIAPWNQQSRQRGLRAANEGLSRLRQLQPPVARNARGSAKSGPQPTTPTQRVRLQILDGELQCCEAELLPDNSSDKAARLLAARQLLQPLVEQRSELEQAELARLLLTRVLRLEGDTRQARTVIEAARRQSRTPPIRDALLREEVECRLAEGDLTVARQLAQPLCREQDSALSAEPGTWSDRLLAARVWIACWRSGMKSHSKLASRDFEAAREILNRGAQTAPGEWRELFVWLGESLEEEVSLGGELAAVSLQIQQALGQNDDQQADLLLARGAELALRRGLRDRAAEWGFQRGSLAVQRKDWGAAAQDLLTVSREFPGHSRAPAAQLLGAYALGRQWRAEMSEDVRNDYRAALEELCRRFPEDSSRAEAEWMLGELSRWEGQLGAAADHFDRIPRGHPRSSAALRGLAELTIQQSRNGQADDKARDRLRERLWGRLPPPAEVLGSDERVIALALAELELTSSQPAWSRIDELLAQMESASPSDTGPTSASEESQLAESTPPASKDTAAVWRLRMLSASAQFHWDDVDRLLQHAAPLNASQWLDLLEQLTRQTEKSAAPVREADRSHLRLGKIAQLLEPQRGKLSRDEQVRFELLMARRAVFGNQPDEARVRFERATELEPEKGRAPLEYAWFLLGLADADSKQAGVALLVRRERQWKAGSEDWLNARIEVVKGLRSAGRAEEACRLLKTTRLLYPKQGTPVQRQTLAELQQQCQ